MNAMQMDTPPRSDSGAPRGPVVEINLLLESQLLADIEAKARERGLTAASMVRRLIRDFVQQAKNG